jgi:phosphoglycerol transferase MdoB-like AlkP superfamily enzyme
MNVYTSHPSKGWLFFLIMLGKVKFLLFYFLFWVLLFQLFRAVFLLYHYGQTKELSFSTITGTFWYGLRMDLSMASYVTIPVCLFVLVSLFLPFFKRTVIYNIHTSLILMFMVLLVIADLEVYKQWLFRIDVTPLKYLSSPREAWASISHLPVFLIIVILVIVYSLLFFGSQRLITKNIYLLHKPAKWAISLLSIVLFIGLLGIAIRGGFQLAPINQSSVYFSTNNFANHAAINAPWNFLHSVMNQSGREKNPYIYMEDEQAQSTVDSLFIATNVITNVLNTKTPNIILIIWESFTEKVTHITVDGNEVTPGFNQLKKEGLYFSQLYASGDRTDKGLSAIISGYPALPKTSILRTPNKAGKLPTLAKLLKGKNYQTPFFYGGEPEFANIKSYLLQGGFDHLVQKSDFNKKDWNSKWGAHDGVVANRVLEFVNKKSSPFFATWLTLSSHEPYEVLGNTVFKGSGYNPAFFNSLHYTDSVVYNFITSAKQQPWWKNTLIVIIADHGHVLPETGHRVDNFKIPMIWLGGALNKRGAIHDKVMGQTDLAATLVGQLAMDAKPFTFSRNAFDSSTKAWSFFSFNNGFGWVEPTGYIIFDHTGKRVEEQQGAIENNSLEKGKAMQQVIFSDFMKR